MMTAPMLPATKALYDKQLAAMNSGQILYTAWTSCRPGAPSAMVMPMNSLAVIEGDRDITLSFEEPRMTRRIRLNAQHLKPRKARQRITKRCRNRVQQYHKRVKERAASSLSCFRASSHKEGAGNRTNSFGEMSVKSSTSGLRNWIRISALRSFSALPHLRMKGTPFQRALFTCSTAAANVGVIESAGTVLSCR